MATSTEIKQRANALADKTDVNSITPKEVGGIMYDLASHGENVLRNGGTLGIRKVYESVSAMEADSTNPKDFWGDPIKKGNLVVIYDGTTTGVDNNKIYAFMKPGWELATKLDAAYATKAETDAKLSELGSNTRKVTCITAASVSEKTIDIPNFSLSESIHLMVYFSYGNTAENMTLNINNTGAHPLWVYGKDTSAKLDANRYCNVIYTSDIGYIAIPAGIFVDFNQEPQNYDLLNPKQLKTKIETVVGKEIDVALTFGKTLTDKGVLVEPEVEGYFISNSIALSSGDVLSITTGGWGIAYLSKVNSDNTYTPISVRSYIIGDEDRAPVNVLVTESGNYVICGRWDLSVSVGGIIANKANKNQVEKLKTKIETVVGKEIDVALTFGKTLTDKGVLVEPEVEGYFISNSIALSSGDVLSITTGGWGIAYLSKVNSDNTYTPISVRTYIIGDEDRATVNVLVPESGNYVICGRWDLSASINPKNLQVYDILLRGELGGFSLDSGLPMNDVSEKELLLRSSFSNRLMSVNVSKGEYIISVEMTDSEELYIEQFDSEFRYIGYSQSLSLMDNCRYIRIAVVNSESIPSTRPIKCKILSAGKPRLICLGQETIGNNGYGRFVYEISPQKKVGESVDTEYHGNKDRLINVGNIILPPNYTREGEPVPLIIHCHGTLGINPKNGVINYNLPYLQFLANNGYAVADCGTVTTSELTTSTSDYDCQFPNQIGMSCYSELVKFLMNKYNLKQDGVYVFGYSAGGMPTIYLSQLQPFNVKCAASLAGSVDVITNNRVLWGETQEIKYWYDTMGMNKEVGTSCLSGGNFGGPIRDEERDELIEHIDNIIGYNPMWMNTVGFDFVNYINEIAKINILNYEDSESLRAIIDKATAYIPVPLKIWHAIDDVNVPIDTTRFYVQMLKRGGSLVILRELPQNCGKHYAMGYTLYDGSSGEVPMVKYKPKYSDEVEIPVVYAELVDWFNNW